MGLFDAGETLLVDCPTCGRTVISIGGCYPYCPHCVQERHAAANRPVPVEEEHDPQDTGVYWNKAKNGFWFPCRNGQWIPGYQWRVSSTDPNTYVLYKDETIKGCYNFAHGVWFKWELVTQTWHQDIVAPWAPYEDNDF